MTTQESHRVKPRLVWIGLALALAGAVLLGLGVALESWTWAVIGFVVLLVGAGAGVRGGIVNDAHRAGLGDEVEQVKEGSTREGIAPGDTIADEKVRHTSRALDVRRREVIAASHQAPRPRMAPMGGMIAVLVTVFLLVAQWEVYPLGHHPQTNANWAMAFAILAGLGGLRILLGQPGKHRLSAAAILLAGVGLLWRAFFAGHEIESTAVIEGITGAITVLAGLMALLSPADDVDALPTQRPESA